MEVAAVYFPSWHVNDHYQAWYGQGFTEWELVKSARPLFPGHHQPKVPLWGYFDESAPEWSAKEIDLAAGHGISAFLFDWYWYSGVRIMEEALEQGFLHAPNRGRLKFALMWANHNWGPWPAVTGEPGMGGVVGSGPRTWLPIRHSPEDLDRVIDYCCEHYFLEPNYWRVEGRPFFAVYDIYKLAEELGGLEEARAGLCRMNERARTYGLPGIYFIANIGCCGDNDYCCGWGRVPSAAEMGFESVFAYNISRTADYNSVSNDYPVVQYEEVIKSHSFIWGEIEKGGLPHFPVVTVGSDVTPRWHRGVSLPMDFKSLAYEPIVEGNTPEKFGELCRLALKRAELNSLAPKAIIVNAWNEWTEGMYLLPEKRYGSGYLEALQGAILSRV